MHICQWTYAYMLLDIYAYMSVDMYAYILVDICIYVSGLDKKSYNMHMYEQMAQL